MKNLLVLFGLMFVIFACSNDCLNMVNECLNGNFSEKNNNENNQGNSNTEGPEKRPTTLQEVVDNANAGEEIDLSKHELTNYTATVNKKLTIKNGSLDNAKLSVKSEGVKLENLTGLSVSASSKLTITDSKLSDLLIGGSGEISRSVTSSAEGALAMVSVTNCKIENVSLDGFNSQLNITDTVTKIEDIVISTKAKIILEAGKYEGMKAPTVKDNGEIARVDMTKKTELVVLSIYSNPYKLEYNIGDKIDLTGLTVMGTYSTDVETFKSGGWKSEGEDTITKCEDEKDYTPECDLSKAGVSIVTITSKKNPEKKCSFHVFVKESQNTDEEKPEEKIEITDVYLKIFGTAKTTYKVGERLDLSCYQVVGKYNGFEVNLPYTSEPANGAVLETAGENIEIKFHYDGGTLTQTIKVTEPWVVTFKDGNEILYTTEVADGGKLSQLPVAPSKTGYTFAGWYNGYNEFKAGDSVTSDLELTATWEKICSVILMVNGQQSIITGKYGVNVEIPDPEKQEGYTFNGWEPPLPETYSETSSTHTAILNPITYTITYENCDGVDNEECPKTYTIEEEKKLVNPTKDGYTFVGWYTNKECTEENKITQINKGTTGNITLYAVWKVQTTFYVDGTFIGETAIGTENNPFATMQEAVNKINEVNDGLAEFTINVQSNIEPDTTISYENNNYALININPDKALNLKICGTQNTDDIYPTISASGTTGGYGAQGRVMYIGNSRTDTKTTVTLENITLTAGYNDMGGGVYIAGGTLNMNNGATIKNCEASEGYGGGVYVVESGELTMESGATIASCKAGLSGAVYLDNGSTFTMNDGEISSCEATNGGAVYLDNGSTFEMYGGTIGGEGDGKGCTATNGGAVYLDNESTFTMNAGKISNCKTVKGSDDTWDYGGAVSVDNGTFTMNDGEISGCGSSYGGGVVIYGDGKFEMSGGSITNCKAPESYGGGVLVYYTATTDDGTSYKGGEFNMTGGTIFDCEAGLGGGVHVAMGTFEMSGSANIESCCATSGDYDTYGGGVYVGGGTFTMSDNASIKNCYATNTNTENKCDGGGVYITYLGKFTMSGGIIGGDNTGGGCTAKDGGGVYITDGGSFEMTGGTIQNCEASLSGGGVWMNSGSSFTMSGNSKIENCTANSEGGGVYVTDSNNPCSFTMNDSATITGCTAQNYGGGGVSYGCGTNESNIKFTMNGGTISDCSSSNGGGVYLYGCFEMTGGIISDNTASNGAGVYVRDDSVFEMSVGTISENTATSHGGGVYVSSSGSFKMTSGTISENNASNGKGVYVSISGTFEFSGSAVVKLGNDVYLSGGTMITITGELNSPEAVNGIVATITPSSYSADVQVLQATDGATLSEQVGKFTVTPDSDVTSWIISTEGKLQKQE